MAATLSRRFFRARWKYNSSVTSCSEPLSASHLTYWGLGFRELSSVQHSDGVLLSHQLDRQRDVTRSSFSHSSFPSPHHTISIRAADLYSVRRGGLLQSGPRSRSDAGVIRVFENLKKGDRILPWSAFQTRGLAAKSAKKSKSRVVEVSESTEDVAETAKDHAVKMMETALDVLSREQSKLRTGRANAGMLDHITVEAHGVRAPLNHIAAVTVSGLQTLNVLPYDPSIVKEVEKAILNSPMGLNPQVDGATLTVPLPRLTKEHCETLCKLVGKAGESAKLSVRRARKEALDMAKKSGDLSKDELKRFEKEVEDLTKRYAKSVDDLCKSKEKEIMA